MTSGLAIGLHRAGSQVGKLASSAYCGARFTFDGLYTFHDTPASCRTSCMVGQVHCQRVSGVSLVSVTGPSLVPAGSIVPLLAISRLGCVGPRIEE
jgi:hypothetical protein